MAGGTPTLGLNHGRSKLYSRHDWKMSPSERKEYLPLVID